MTNIRWKKMIAGSKRYRKFPIIDVWGGLLNTISRQLPPLLLSAFFSPIIVGYYALGSAVVRLPMVMIGGAIGQVFYQKASEVKNKGGTTEIVASVYKRLVALGLFPMMLLCIVGEDLFSVTFGHDWSEAGIYTQILAPWMFFAFISSPLSALFFVFERQRSALIVHSIIFLTRVMSLYIGGALGNVYTALALFSASGVLVYAGVGIWSMRLADVPVSIFVTVCLRYFCYFLPSCLSLLLVKSWFNISPVTSVLIAALAIVGYGIIVFSRDSLLKDYIRFNRTARTAN